MPGPRRDITARRCRTFAFPAVTAKYFRLSSTPGLAPAEVIHGEDDSAPPRGGFTAGPPSYGVTERDLLLRCARETGGKTRAHSAA